VAAIVPTGWPRKYTTDFLSASHASFTRGCGPPKCVPTENGESKPEGNAGDCKTLSKPSFCLWESSFHDCSSKDLYSSKVNLGLSIINRERSRLISASEARETCDDTLFILLLSGQIACGRSDPRARRINRISSVSMLVPICTGIRVSYRRNRPAIRDHRDRISERKKWRGAEYNSQAGSTTKCRLSLLLVTGHYTSRRQAWRGE
jgi:hypothetical protein